MLMSHSKIMLPTNTGMICGRIANQRIWNLVPPAARIASIGFGSTSSIASAIVFEMKPIERTAIASTPASAPRPTAETKIRPQTISCTERDIVIRKRPTAYELLPNGVMLAAPSQATGIDITRPSTVASVAITTVSSVAFHRSSPTTLRSSWRKRTADSSSEARLIRLQSVSRTTMTSMLQATAIRITA